MSAHQALEHSEHISHAAHGHDHDNAPSNKLGTYVGITMAILGVLLAFCAAKVGGERTELVQTLVEQQNAHAKYQAQDIKHRVAFLDLQAVHALDVNPTNAVDKKELLAMANTVSRYLEEANAAKEWVEAFDPAVAAHVHAQEYYEIAQLCAEIGIVIASVALLMKKRLAWFAALLLGAAAVGTVGYTLSHTGSAVASTNHKIEALGKAYRELRTTNKTTEAEGHFIEAIRKSAGAEVAPHHPKD